MFKLRSKESDSSEVEGVSFQSRKLNAARFHSLKRNTNRDDVVAWLRDAHAMESSHIENLHQLAETSKQYPVLQRHFQDHIAVTAFDSATK